AEFWTRTRMLTALGFGGGTLLFLALAFSVQIIRTRAAAAAAIATVKRELETIFDSTTSGIMAFDAAGQVVRINNQARHFLGGLSTPVPFEWPNEVKFLDVEDMHPLDASADPIRRAIAGAELRFSTHLMNRPNAGESHRYVRLESSTLDNVDTDIRTVVVFDDVSDEERNRQVVERKGRLEALGQLTGGIAHDFNNHLTTLLTSIFLAGNAKDETGRNRHLKVAEGAVQRARSVTTRLTAFARRQPGLSVSTSVREVFRTFEELVRPMIESSFQLTFEAEDPDLMIFCELAQLESALLNLVLNSRDAILRSGKGSRITIKARAIGHKGVDGTQVASQDGPDQFVEVSVTDNGPGMSDEVLSRATDPFFTTKDTNSGTGLGLSMVYGFARQADGDLRIYSEEGIGTTVQLTLPRGTRDGARRTKPEADEIIMGNGEMILLAEDEPQILETTTTLLEELGYKVLSAANGKEAYDLLKFNPQIDLLLTDVVMPGEIGGFSLAEKAREINPVLPIIYFSGYTGYSALEMGQVKGQLLQKPAAPAQLTRAIKSALAELE
ncbi:MAG: ATP-binding protein, partial [Pseudomonadota bacterium]